MELEASLLSKIKAKVTTEILKMDSSTVSDDEIDSIDVEKLFCDCCHRLHAKVSEKRQALDATLADMIKYIENIENVTKTDGEEGNTSQKVMWLILRSTLQLLCTYFRYIQHSYFLYFRKLGTF